jgi:hypothetical protein
VVIRECSRCGSPDTFDGTIAKVSGPAANQVRPNRDVPHERACKVQTFFWKYSGIPAQVDHTVISPDEDFAGSINQERIGGGFILAPQV